MGNRRGGLLFGVIVGTLLGILFAPRKGKELRNQLKNEVSKGGMGVETFKKNFKEMGHDVASTAEEVYARSDVQKAVRSGKKHVDDMMRNAGEQVGKVEKYLHIDDEQLEQVSEKIHNASKKVQNKLHTLKHKYMGDLGFTKKPLSTPKRSRGAHKKSSTKKTTARSSSSSGKKSNNKKSGRTKNIKIKKH